jgi:hypothetical protein
MAALPPKQQGLKPHNLGQLGITFWGELPEAAWQRIIRRDPSTPRRALQPGRHHRGAPLRMTGVEWIVRWIQPAGTGFFRTLCYGRELHDMSLRGHQWPLCHPAPARVSVLQTVGGRDFHDYRETTAEQVPHPLYRSRFCGIGSGDSGWVIVGNGSPDEPRERVWEAPLSSTLRGHQWPLFHRSSRG